LFALLSEKKKPSMNIGNKRYKKRVIIPLLIVGAVIAIIILPFISWLITDESITATSDAQFCVSCHSMEPFEKAHEADVHGGQNDHGVRATCAQCHLPHDSSFNYMYTKARTGLHDLYVERLGDPENIDWQAKRAHREEWVYDSGCLTCHTNLQEATMATNDALIAHKAYFLGTTEDQCVTCHEHVGHYELSKYISSN
jgi:cytochrome c-type protein NapC